MPRRGLGLVLIYLLIAWLIFAAVIFVDELVLKKYYFAAHTPDSVQDAVRVIYWPVIKVLRSLGL